MDKSARKDNPATNRLLLMLMMVASGIVELSDEQIDGVNRILLSALFQGFVADKPPVSPVGLDPQQIEVIAGYDALAAFLGYSVPTCVKLSKEGRFDAAVIDYGGNTRKKMWDKRKLLEIGRENKK